MMDNKKPSEPVEEERWAGRSQYELTFPCDSLECFPCA